MAQIFITGSSDGLGLTAARLLIEQGHEVVLHGRNDSRSRDALAAAPGARAAVTGDLSTIAGARTVADQVNRLGRFHAVVHNRQRAFDLLRAAWLRPKQTDLVPDNGQFRSRRFPQSAQLRLRQ